MTLLGHIKNGIIVLDEPCPLPEGAVVHVQIVEPPKAAARDVPSLFERLKPAIGQATGLPPDAARNVDHYLYGHPKQ